MTARRLETLRKPGRYRAGQTLYPVVEPGGSKHWAKRPCTASGRRVLTVALDRDGRRLTGGVRSTTLRSRVRSIAHFNPSD